MKDARSRGTRLGQERTRPRPRPHRRSGTATESPTGRAGQGRAGWPQDPRGAALSADTGTTRASLRAIIRRAPWTVSRGGGAAARTATELHWEWHKDEHAKPGALSRQGLFLPPLRWLPHLPPSAKTELAALPRVAALGRFQQVQSSVNAGRLQGAEGSRASCWETLTPAGMGPAGLAAPLPAWAGSDPRLCARSIPARQLPAPRGPDCRAPRRGARHFPTPTCALHSLTAPEPMEMHQKLLSNELILVQSC